MARRGNRTRLTEAKARPPVVREFSAGGLVYRRRAGICSVVLAGRRQPRTGQLVWGMPKGHVEPGESSEAAAAREVREETGLRAEVEHPLGDLTYWYVRHDERGRPVRVLKRVRFFLMRSRGGRFADRDDEMDVVRWIDIEDAETRATYANERVLLRRARALLEPGGER